MSRCRLRLSLHEIDLPLGVTVVGRALDCHVTLDDPLVSRRHARIVVGSDRAVVEDLDSRNGVLVNGARVRQLTPLSDGDRIRVGGQDLVFSELGGSSPPPPGRPTAEVRFCASCRRPSPRDVATCPVCEATEKVDEDTLAGGGTQGTSILEFLVEALERALNVGLIDEAQQLVRRAAEHVAQLVSTSGSVDPRVLDALAMQIVALTARSHDPTWALWALDAYRDNGQAPPVDVVDRLTEVQNEVVDQHCAAEVRP